jgi:hypothetical protein
LFSLEIHGDGGRGKIDKSGQKWLTALMENAAIPYGDGQELNSDING